MITINNKRSLENVGEDTPKDSEYAMWPRFNQNKPERDVVVIKSTIGTNISKPKIMYKSKRVSKETITEEQITSKSIPEVPKFDRNNFKTFQYYFK